jgi:HSP20 family molecular chaperone IbpA
VEALYRNGLLVITMHKAEHSQPRQIPVHGISAETKVG